MVSGEKIMVVDEIEIDFALAGVSFIANTRLLWIR